MHTPLCRHARGEPEAYAAHAVSLGFEEIGFSDHNPMRKDGFDNWRMNLSDMASYLGSVRVAREMHPGLRILVGLEVDYLPGHEDWIRELAAMHPWDYLIGSVHYIEDWAIDDPSMRPLWEHRDTFEIWSAYFERLGMAARSGLFDIIGHADLCKKFGFHPKQDCSSLYGGFLREAARAGVAVELNTAGLRKDCREIYPGLTFLTLARAAGIPITFGSDAHAPEEVGAGFERAIEHARLAGYTHAVRLRGREKRAEPLSSP